MLADLYYLAFPKDPRRNKLLVYGVYLLELVQTVMLTHSAFTVFGFGYGDLSQFNNVDLAWFEVPIISGIGKNHLSYYFSISSYPYKQ